MELGAHEAHQCVRSRPWLTLVDGSARSSSNPCRTRLRHQFASPLLSRRQSGNLFRLRRFLDNERLDQLIAEYARIKPRVEELTAQLKELTDAIKLALTVANPGETRIPVEHPSLTDPLVLRYVPSPRLDTKRIKAEAPDVYEQYVIHGGRWELRVDKDNRNG